MRTFRAAARAAIGVDRVGSDYTDVVGSIVDPEIVARCMDGVDVVIHAATLHKPHVATHGSQEFIDTNVTGTSKLLEAAVRAGVRAFVYTSTTSAFGDALVPGPGAPAAWITDDVAPVAKNIYGVTKVAAEELCALAHRNSGLPCVILRTSRFFPEPDDDPAARAAYADANLKANEFLAPTIDRVYDNTRARADLCWEPRHDFAAVVARASTGDIRSPLARAIGIKGYYGSAYADGLYPVGGGGRT